MDTNGDLGIMSHNWKMLQERQILSEENGLRKVFFSDGNPIKYPKFPMGHVSWDIFSAENGLWIM